MIPVLLQLVVHQLERDVVSVCIAHCQSAQISGPVPNGQLCNLTACMGQAVEQMENTGSAAASFGAGHAHKVFNAVACACAFRLAVVCIDIDRNRGCIDLFCDHAHCVCDLSVGSRHRGLEQSHCMLSGILYTGAGQDVVEMGK